MIESSRFNNHPAWFVGESNSGDYYDQVTGQYKGSWSRIDGQFVNPTLIDQNLFNLPVWLDHERRKRGLLSRAQDVVVNIKDLISAPTPNPLHLEGPYVAILGDSFAAHISAEHWNQWRQAGRDMGFRSRSDSPAWPSLVADQLELNLAPYGFGGRSWWWSWQRFWNDWHQDLRRLDAIVFLHTGYDRINNGMDPKLPHILNMPTSFYQSHPIDKVQAMESYFLHVHDTDFQRWAQQQFFRYLRDALPPMKILHFFCLSVPTPATCDLLPGMVFRTPLLLLSAAEYEDTRPKHWPFPDMRANHFNEHNNQALANLICRSIEHYQPGIYEIDHREFYQFKPKKFSKQLSNILLEIEQI